MQYDTHIGCVKEFNLDLRSEPSVFLMNERNSNVESLQINDDKKYEYSATKHTQVGIVSPSEGLINSVWGGGFGHYEMD